MPGLFAVGLIAFEVMNRGANFVSGFFVRTNSIDMDANRQQSLKWNHDFVVFDEITSQ